MNVACFSWVVTIISVWRSLTHMIKVHFELIGASRENSHPPPPNWSLALLPGSATTLIKIILFYFPRNCCRCWWCSWWNVFGRDPANRRTTNCKYTCTCMYNANNNIIICFQAAWAQFLQRWANWTAPNSLVFIAQLIENYSATPEEKEFQQILILVWLNFYFPYISYYLRKWGRRIFE